MNSFYKIGDTIMTFMGIALLLVVPVYFLWNWLVPIIFIGENIAPHITFFQAWGILILCGFLFKSSAVKVQSSTPTPTKPKKSREDIDDIITDLFGKTSDKKNDIGDLFKKTSDLSENEMSSPPTPTMVVRDVRRYP
jgi:hypothetical protein